MRLYDMILGKSWVYEHLRPFVVGGLNCSIAYEYLEARDTDIIVDVGCGMGDALNYLKNFSQYHGFDIDTYAIRKFQRRNQQSNVFIYNRILTKEDILRIKPHKAVLIGLLHHLSDGEVLDLLETLSIGGFIKRIIALDPVYIKGELLSNLLGFFDRGRYVRTGVRYEAIFVKSPFALSRKSYSYSGNGLSKCFLADLRAPQ